MCAELFQHSAELYDQLIDWPKRLANEAPFYRALFTRIGVRSVLDVACGTGQHAALFHSWGLHVTGADISPAMITRCRSHWGESESLRWIVRSFDQPHERPGEFDAAVCVGNSLALADDLAALDRGLECMLSAVRPGGVCVVQVLNLWHLPDGPCVWQKYLRASLGGQEHILVKGVHRAGARGFVDLAVSADGVSPRFESTPFLGVEADHLVRVAARAGAGNVRCLGSFQQDAYQREQSDDLILVAER